ncbi:MAG: hypothetical protein KC503_02690 [Myxococcales bacterium]|nr:hypothetical protein [Myxococcales bacterium]
MIAAAAAAVAALCGAASCGQTFRFSAEVRARAAKQLPPLDDARAELTVAPLGLQLTLPFDRTLDASAHVSSAAVDVLGELRAGDKLVTPLRVRRIGNFSRLTCSYPKLLLALPDDERAPRRSYIVLSHCNDKSTLFLDGHHLGGMRLAFALHAAFDLPTLRVRRVRIDYVDSAHQKPRRAHKPALLVEHVRDLAARAGGGLARYRLSGGGELSSVDDVMLARLHLFQILINNGDWKVYSLQPLARYIRRDTPRAYLHNVALVGPRAPGQPALPSAFDFDISTLVGVPRGVAELSGGSYEELLSAIASPHVLRGESSLSRWAVLNLIHFLRRHGADAARRALAFVAPKRALFDALVARARVGADAKKRAREHVAAFYRALQATTKLWRVRRAVPLYATAGGARRACDAIAAGAPLELVEGGDAASRPSDGRVAVRPVQVVRVVVGKGLEPLCNKGGSEASVPQRAFIERAAIEPLR